MTLHYNKHHRRDWHYCPWQNFLVLICSLILLTVLFIWTPCDLPNVAILFANKEYVTLFTMTEYCFPWSFFLISYSLSRSFSLSLQYLMLFKMYFATLTLTTLSSNLTDLLVVYFPRFYFVNYKRFFLNPRRYFLILIKWTPSSPWLEMKWFAVSLTFWFSYILDWKIYCRRGVTRLLLDPHR